MGRGGRLSGLCPGMQAGPQPVHPPVQDALQDGSKGGDADACPDEHSMLGGEDPAVGGPVRAIDVALHAGGVRGKTGWVGEGEADPDASGPPFICRQSSPGLDLAPTQSTFYTLWSEPESGRALERSHAELVRAGPSQHAPCALRGQGFGSVIWRPGSQTVGTVEPGYQEPQQALPVGRGFDSSAWGHPLEPLTLMLQNWWFSEDTLETCRE